MERSGCLASPPAAPHTGPWLMGSDAEAGTTCFVLLTGVPQPQRRDRGGRRGDEEDYRLGAADSRSGVQSQTGVTSCKARSFMSFKGKIALHFQPKYSKCILRRLPKLCEISFFNMTMVTKLFLLSQEYRTLNLELLPEDLSCGILPKTTAECVKRADNHCFSTLSLPTDRSRGPTSPVRGTLEFSVRETEAAWSLFSPFCTLLLQKSPKAPASRRM